MKSAMKTYIKQREKESNIKESIEDMENWNQEFGNMFAGFLGMFFVFSLVAILFKGCNGFNSGDVVVTPKEEQTEDDPSFNASDWILFK
jgi:hypothetical protein